MWIFCTFAALLYTKHIETSTHKMAKQDTDWKAALAGAFGLPQDNADEAKVQQPSAVERKKRSGVVFSTNPDYEYSSGDAPEAATLPNNQQRLRVSMERAGRGGKTVTLVRGFVGTDDDLKALGRLLRQRCGVGGSADDGEILVQGDHRQRVVEILKAEGYTQTK